MDFEVLTSREGGRNIFHEVADFFKNRRRQLQDWDSNPPHTLGWFVLFLVALELVVAWRMTQSRGFSREIIGQTISIGFFLLVIEMALAKVGQEVGEFFKKKGRFFTTLTFFNISLMPLLLILPIALLNWTLPKFGLLVLLMVVVLFTKVLANFRESLEISFEFSRLQSALVLYLSSGLITVGVFIAIYISLFSILSDVITTF